MTKYHDCDCLCKVIRIEHDKDCGVLISIYTQGSNKFSLGYKLRLIWHIIKHGSPYDDEVVLSKESARSLAEDILKEIS